MNKNTKIIIGIIAALAIVGGVYAFVSSTNTVVEQENMSEKQMMVEKETMEEKSEMDNDVPTDEMMKGSYEIYSPEKLIQAETGAVVLFFHASWCPSCRSLGANIESNVDLIPEGVSILKVDFDKETELRKKYGVTSQHTLVQVDADGNFLKKWSGSPNLSSLLSQIKL